MNKLQQECHTHPVGLLDYSESVNLLWVYLLKLLSDLWTGLKDSLEVTFRSFFGSGVLGTFIVLHSVSHVPFSESTSCLVKESGVEEEEEEEWTEIIATGGNGWSIQRGGGNGLYKRWRERDCKSKAERGRGRWI